MKGRLSLPISLLITFVMANAACAQKVPEVSSGPFCGIYSLYTALRSQNVDLEFSQLLRPDYVSSASGSTLSDLLHAAQDHHAYGQIVENLNVADLRHLDCPAILHVKNEYDAPDYNHFLLCVPLSEGQLGLYDPPGAMTRSAGHELAPIWDGTALLVAARPIDLMPMRRWAVVRIALAIVVALVAVGIPFLIRIRTRRDDAAPKIRLQPLSQCGLLGGIAIALGSGYHLLAPEGFRAQRPAVAAITAAAAPISAPQIDFAEARDLWQQGVLFVDARHTEDYQQDHIASAISIPPDASRQQRAGDLAGRAQHVPLVVYCQSPSCGYARLLARRLGRDGFDNIKVFAGGWEQWQGPTQSTDHVALLAPATEGGL